MLREQKYCQKRFSKKVLFNNDRDEIGSFWFLRRKHAQHRETTQKVELIADGSYEVISKDGTTVPAKIGANIERDSHGRVVASSVMDTRTSYLVDDSASHHSQHGSLTPAT